jgi:beta-fructofuranosidase
MPLLLETCGADTTARRPELTRPKLHFTARSGWINDPHGITYRDGQYHAFYQYVPDQTVWGPNCHWGHATGVDLLTLTEGSVAIAPGEGDDGIWTGSLVTDDDGRSVIFYTSTSAPDIGIGRVRTALPADRGWQSWTKGPFVADAPAELDIIAYRDPFVRREPDGWRMFLGAGLRDGTATALSYFSEDLHAWAYEGIALQRSTNDTEDVWMGALWECPQIFEVDGHAVMVSSIWDDDVLHYAGYAIGRYERGAFDADGWGRLTYGDSYYAPSLFTDADGRPCLLFWMRGIGGAEDGWASAHSVPYVLSVREGALVARPHPDVDAHRGQHRPDAIVDGLAADIVWDGEDGALTIFSESVEVVRIRRSGDVAFVDIGGDHTDLPVNGSLRVLVDGPTLEISSNGAIFGARIDPAGMNLRVDVTGGSINVHTLS